MARKFAVILLLVVLGALAVGCGLLREPEEASGPIEAIPLELETQEAEEEDEQALEPEQELEPELEPELEEEQEAYPEPAEVAGADAAATEAYPNAVEATDAGDGAAGQLRVYQISQEDSHVTFELDEDLRGERTTVVGSTDQVAGELALNLADLSTAQIGPIQINARTLLSDNNFRNRAIQNEILDTGTYEFITFTPSAIVGLPESVAIGEEVAFTVEGELTIRDVSQPASFDVVTVALSETELSGRAVSTVERADFGLIIPQVRQVANVEETVALTIDFLARAV